MNAAQRRERAGYEPKHRSIGLAMPFGNESWYRERFDLTAAQTAVVVCLCAAALCCKPESSVREIEQVIDYRAQGMMRLLQRKRWIEYAGKDKFTQKWRATPRAFDRLGLRKWEPLLDTAEQELWLKEAS